MSVDRMKSRSFLIKVENALERALNEQPSETQPKPLAEMYGEVVKTRKALDQKMTSQG